MKNILVSSALVALLATAAEAQTTHGSGGGIRGGSQGAGAGYGSGSWGCGTGYGYGYSGYGTGYSSYSGTGYGYGFGSGCGCGFGSGYGYSGFGSSTFGSGFGLGDFDLGPLSIGSAGLFSGVGYAGGLYGSPMGGMVRGFAYPPYGYAAPTRAMLPPPQFTLPASPDRLAEAASAREVENGLKHFKAGDYRGAVDAFRLAVVAHTENPLAQAYFALGLIVIGEGKNADKALRLATERGTFEKIDLRSMFKDVKERDRVLGVLGRISGDGLLTAAWAQSLATDPDRLKELAQKDPVAKTLLAR